MVYYKTIYADSLFYMGGKVQMLSVKTLLPGETICLQGAYLAGEQSRVLRIEYKRSSIE